MEERVMTIILAIACLIGGCTFGDFVGRERVANIYCQDLYGNPDHKFKDVKIICLGPR